MTLAELIAACRTRADDLQQPPLWSDDEWRLYLTEAEREACVRAKLLKGDDLAAVSEIDIEPGVTRYRLHPAIIEVMHVASASHPSRVLSGWDVDETHLVLDRAPQAADTLRLTVYRLPLADSIPDGGPEIRAMHHHRLIDWALRCAYLKQDAETSDPDKAARYEAMFARSFGERPDANVLRKHKRRTPRVVRMNF